MQCLNWTAHWPAWVVDRDEAANCTTGDHAVRRQYGAGYDDGGMGNFLLFLHYLRLFGGTCRTASAMVGRAGVSLASLPI